MELIKRTICSRLDKNQTDHGIFIYKYNESPSGGKNSISEKPVEEAKEDKKTPEVKNKTPKGIPITNDNEVKTGKNKKEDRETADQEQEKNPVEFIPERNPEALSGTKFAERLQDLERRTVKRLKAEGKKSPSQIRSEQIRVREQAIYEQIVKGNIPDKMREFKEVPVSASVEGQQVEGTIKVMPDYLMIGSNEDAVRVPMTAMTAQLIARQMNCTLPTDDMVDAIAHEAKAHGKMLNPKPQGDSNKFMDTEYFLRHDKTVRSQLSDIDGNPLIVGNKKDIILPYDDHGANNVVIYGWHKPNGDPIQNYSGPHHAWFYLDYSHGVRLVSQQMTLKMPNGKTINARVSDVLQDKLPDGTHKKNLHKLLARAKIPESQSAYKHPGLVNKIDIRELQKSSPPTEVADTTNKNTEPQPAETEQFSQTPEETVPASSSSGAFANGGGSSYGGQSSGGGVGYGRGSSYSTPQPAPGQSGAVSESAPAYGTAASSVESTASNVGHLPGITRAENPHEFAKLNNVPPLEGKTGFFGDSINTLITNAEYLSGQGHEYFAKSGKRTPWLLEKVKSNREQIKKLKRAVVLIGTNDIGMGGSETPNKIFSRIEAIWELILHINPDIKLYACTIPPFGNYKGYRSKKPIIDNRRAEINKKIRDYAKANPSINLIDICLPVEEGGLAVAGNPPDGEAMDKSVCREPLHPDKNALAMVYGRAVHNVEGTNKAIPQGTSQVEKNSSNQPPEVSGNFEKSDEFNEYVQTYNYPETAKNGLKVHINKPENFDNAKPTRVIIYALPAGNTIPQTVGKTKSPGEDWHFDIQHIGAQTRKLRQIKPNENIVVAYVQGPQKSMSNWLKHNNNGNEVLNPMLEDIKKRTGAPNATINLSSHSAGGSMIRAIVENNQEIPDSINRLSFLDSINQFSALKYGAKVLSWLKRSAQHHLSLVSYDDRTALLKGEPFPGRGSSHTRTMEMIQFLKDNGVALKTKNKNGYTLYTGLNGQINIALLKNPQSRILHTETVLRNGFIFAETAGSTFEDAAPFNGPIAYKKLIQHNQAAA